MRFTKLFVSIFSISILFTSCKERSEAEMKDIGRSPTDMSKKASILWKTSDGKVHRGECPANATPINRNCPGLTEATPAIEWDSYKQGLFAVMFMKRTGATTLPSLSAPDVIKGLEDKIARIESKLKSGTLSVAENTTFTGQLTKLQTELSNNKITLTAAEQTKADETLERLETGKDLILDQGEELYELAIIQFNGFCTSPGKKVGPACWYLGAFGDDCNSTCIANGRVYDDATVNFAGSAGTDKNCSKIAEAFGLTFTTSSQMSNYGCSRYGPGWNLPRATLAGLVFRGTGETVANSAVPSIQRFCACK